MLIEETASWTFKAIFVYGSKQFVNFMTLSYNEYGDSEYIVSLKNKRSNKRKRSSIS